MLNKRIIPCLDIKDGRVVKGIKFLGLQDAGDPVEAARIYDLQGADELVFLDITASFEKRRTLVGLVKNIAENIFLPFTVGGGINDCADIRNLLNAGADKISLNTAAVRFPGLVKEASARFGSQCIVVAIDAKLIDSSEFRVQSEKLRIPNSELKTKKWQIFIHGGRTAVGLDAVEWAKQVAGLGAGEILLTSMDQDGTKDGYDLELTKAIAGAVNIPVIASGGAGKLEHFSDVFIKAGAGAALAASLFHYGELSVKDVKKYLKSKKVAVRL